MKEPFVPWPYTGTLNGDSLTEPSLCWSHTRVIWEMYVDWIHIGEFHMRKSWASCRRTSAYHKGLTGSSTAPFWRSYRFRLKYSVSETIMCQTCMWDSWCLKLLEINSIGFFEYVSFNLEAVLICLRSCRGSLAFSELHNDGDLVMPKAV